MYRVRVCVSLLIRSVKRCSIERFVVHSYVLMTQELKSSIICCPFRYRFYRGRASRSGLSVSSAAIARYSTENGRRLLREFYKRRKKEERKNQNPPEGMACACVSRIT